MAMILITMAVMVAVAGVVHTQLNITAKIPVTSKDQDNTISLSHVEAEFIQTFPDQESRKHNTWETDKHVAQTSYAILIMLILILQGLSKPKVCPQVPGRWY